MQTFVMDVLATDANFDEAAYLDANPDVRAAVQGGAIPSGALHFAHFGRAEGRTLRRAGQIGEAQDAKLRRIAGLFRPDLPHVRRGAKYDFLTDRLRSETRIADTGAVSANPYDDAAIALIAACEGGIVADCGAGRRPVYYAHVVNIEIVDYDTTDVIAVGEALPFRDETVDAVISTAVLEHVRDPFRCAAEIARILKPGGRLLCTVPFLQPEHGYPHHYYNMTRQGLRALFEDRLDIDDHVVAPSTLPVWSLTWFLKSWADGLDGPARDAFRALTIGEVADGAPSGFLGEDWVTGLSAAKNFELASATVLSAHKPLARPKRRR